MRTSRVKAKLAKNQPVLGTTLHLMDAALFELASLMGYDLIWMDMEHHTYSLETAATMMRAARVGGADIIARPARGEFTRLQRMLEAGAQGIMYPRCASAEEARQVVEAVKFAPQGRRGCDASNPDAQYCLVPQAQYVRRANEETFIIIQLEEPEAIERAEEIAAVEGIDALMLGPGDLSVLTGIPAQMDHPTIQKAFETVAAGARNAGKHLASVTFSAEHAKKMLDMGARILFHGADILLIKAGLERIQREFAAIGVGG